MEAGVAMDDHADGLSEVFAFGSNLDLTDFIAWCRRERGLTPKIERISGLGCVIIDFLGIITRLFVVVVLQISTLRRVIRSLASSSKSIALLLAALDAKEGHPERYLRQEVSVECMDAPRGMRKVWTYRVTPTYRTEGPVKPLQAYIDIVLKDSRTGPPVSVAC